MSGAHVVILGAGHAGGTAAALLRQYGHEGPITLVGDEPIAPYQRPPLSKAWLKGEADADSLALIELVEALEEDLAERSVGFRIEDEDLVDLKTVRDAVDYVHDRVK